MPDAPRRTDALVADALVVDPEAVQPVGDGFSVRLDVFEGPFDVLLHLVARRKLDLTTVALAQVTDEFLAWLRARSPELDLGEATGFLVIAATLLDLKTARLLPRQDTDDEEDLALLEAGDLLFARLLQYRAYKQVSQQLAALLEENARLLPRSVTLEERFAAALPDLVLGLGPEQFAALAAEAMAPRRPPEVAVDHVHLARVNVWEHAAILAERLQVVGSASFRALCADCRETLEVVARFLALLELFREGRVAFAQSEPLADLRVTWRPTGRPDDAARAQPAEAPPDDASPTDAPAPDGPTAPTPGRT
ncbi:MAG: segregation/condensation protein [Mycobacterium sp.]|jgi:segregation and condensation protein A|nr:segregation/condensation protein [Mycobacterium sp.]